MTNVLSKMKTLVIFACHMKKNIYQYIYIYNAHHMIWMENFWFPLWIRPSLKDVRTKELFMDESLTMEEHLINFHILKSAVTISHFFNLIDLLNIKSFNVFIQNQTHKLFSVKFNLLNHEELLLFSISTIIGLWEEYFVSLCNSFLPHNGKHNK